MCMALPGDNRNEPPKHLLQRIADWIHFGVLVTAFLALGLWHWVAQRWIVRNPNTR